MNFIKAAVLGTILSATIAVVVGSQGSSGGQLAVHLMAVGDVKVFWSWPVFFSGTGLAWALMLLQK